MDIVINRPPGRPNRKARAFNAQIHRLHAAGYSCEAIRLALVDVGLVVCLATVKRETRRSPVGAVGQGSTNLPPAAFSAAPPPDSLGSLPAGSAAGSPGSAQPGSHLGVTRTGKEIADTFMKGRITNPLMQDRKEPP